VVHYYGRAYAMAMVHDYRVGPGRYTFLDLHGQVSKFSRTND